MNLGKNIVNFLKHNRLWFIKKILDIIYNGDTSHTAYSSQINWLMTLGATLGSYNEAVYPRFAATHGVEEN